MLLLRKERWGWVVGTERKLWLGGCVYLHSLNCEKIVEASRAVRIALSGRCIKNSLQEPALCSTQAWGKKMPGLCALGFLAASQPCCSCAEGA